MSFALPVRAQEPSSRPPPSPPSFADCLRWLREGGGGALPIRLDVLLDDRWDDLVQRRRVDELVGAAADLAEDQSAALAARQRSIQLLQHLLTGPRVADLDGRSQERAVRATLRLTAVADLPATVRGPLLVWTAGLQDQRGRLDWLLEGQVRLRNRLRGAPAVAGDDALLPSIVDYLGRLGEPAGDAFGMICDLLVARDVAPALRTSAGRAAGQLAAHAGRDAVGAALLGCARALPRHPDELPAFAPAMEAMAAVDGAITAPVREALLQLVTAAATLPPAASRPATRLLGRIAVVAPQDTAAALFAALEGQRGPAALGDEAVVAMQAIAAARTHNVFVEPGASRALLALLREFDPATARARLGSHSIAVASILQHDSAKLRAAGDHAAARDVRARCDELAAAMAKSSYPALRTAARAWRRSAE